MTSHLNVHLISDSTGETVHQVARAALAQFSQVTTSEYIWTLVRTSAHLDSVSTSLKSNPGLVLYSVVDETIRKELEDICTVMNVPSLSVLDPVVDLLSTILGYEKNTRR